MARTIYLATDDPITVKKEISKLPRGQGGTTIVGGKLRQQIVVILLRIELITYFL